MFEQWLSVAYKNDLQKTAARQLINKLHALPMEELLKAASGDPTSKLAYADGPSDEATSWIGKYKGSPLFEKAVELEKALLQIDMEENQRRAEENAEPKASSDTYERKDAIKLQQRMLDLDLVMEGAGVENPEAKEEQGVQLLEQAQQQEAAAGEGNEPHEKAEDAAIQQFRGAQQQEAAAPKTEVKVGNAMDLREVALKTGKGLRAVGSKAKDFVAKHPGETVAGVSAASIGGGLALRGHIDKKMKAEDKEKTAGTLGSDTRRLAPGSNNEVLHGGSTQGNGTLGDYQPSTDDHLSNVSEGLQVNKTAAAHSLAEMDAAGRLLAKTAEVSANTATVLHSLLNPLPGSTVGAIGSRFLTDPHDPEAESKATRYGALGGGALGALTGGSRYGLPGALVGGGMGALGGATAAKHVAGKVVREHAAEHAKEKKANVLSTEAREHIKPKNFALPNANGGKGGYPIENKGHAENALSRVDTFGSPSERSKVHAEVAKKYPALAARSSVPDVAAKGHKALQKAASYRDILKDTSSGATSFLKKHHVASPVAAGAGGLMAGAALQRHGDKLVAAEHSKEKAAGVGGSLVQAGQKALTAGKGMLANAGGMSGLASKGVGLAKANPLATAGIAAGAGLAGGAMLGRASKQSPVVVQR